MSIPLKSFKDLIVWQKAANLATLAYGITERFPHSELYGLTNQMRRSVISISSNIAEGFKRIHKKEKLQFYNIAYGSAAELESQTEISLKLKFINLEEYHILISPIIETSKMIDSLIRSVNNKFPKFPKLPKPPNSPKSYILNSIFFFIFLYSISYILNPLPVQAADIFFGTQAKDVGVGTKFEVGVFLDAQKESINAIEGQIIFPSDEFELQGFYTGNSILNFWIQQPTLISQGVISFSGIMPGGFTGSNGYLFSLILKAKQKGSFTISTANEKILLNDGKGTEAMVVKAPLHLNIIGNNPLQTFTPLSDTTGPELFEPQIGQDPSIFNGKYFLAFSAQDKGSGIDHYEVCEDSEFRIQDLGKMIARFLNIKSYSLNSCFVKSDSPYLLKDQTLKSIIFVKAVDKSGNETTVKVNPKNNLAWYENYLVWVIIILIIIFFIGYTLWKRKH